MNACAAVVSLCVMKMLSPSGRKCSGWPPVSIGEKEMFGPNTVAFIASEIHFYWRGSRSKNDPGCNIRAKKTGIKKMAATIIIAPKR